MGAIKSKQRSRLTDRHLTDFLRAATTELQPDFHIWFHISLMFFMFCFTG